MPVLNESRYLDHTLEALSRQTISLEEFEVLILDGGSIDNTMEIVAKWDSKFPNYRSYTNPRKLPSSARNIGLEFAKGDVIAFVEGHCVVPDCYVRRALELLDEMNVDALGRPITLLVPGDPPIQQAIGIARQSSLGHARSSLLYGNFEGICSPISCATIYRRSVFQQLGSFDESLWVGEDVDFNQRFEKAGLRHFFSQDLRCYYHPRQTFSEFFLQMMHYGIGRTRASIIQRSASLSDLAPLLVLGAVSAFAFGLTGLHVWFAIPFLTYLVLMIIYSMWECAKLRKLLSVPLVSIAIVIVHVGLGIGQVMGWFEWALRTRRLRMDSSANYAMDSFRQQD